MKSQPISKQTFEEEVQTYFAQFGIELYPSEVEIEWKRFQKGRSWFNAHLGEYHHE